MATARHLAAIPEPAPDDITPTVPSGVSTAEALASFLRHLANRRGRSGRITSPETVRSYTSALPTAFAGISHLGELADGGRERLHTNIRTAWGGKAPATFNAKRAAVGSALAYFHEQDWIGDPAAVLAGLDREHQPKPTDNRVRTREQIDRLITDKRQSMEDRTLWSMLYSTAARAEEVLRLDVEDLDRANRRARTTRKGRQGRRPALRHPHRPDARPAPRPPPHRSSVPVHPPRTRGRHRPLRGVRQGKPTAPHDLPHRRTTPRHRHERLGPA